MRSVLETALAAMAAVGLLAGIARAAGPESLPLLQPNVSGPVRLTQRVKRPASRVPGVWAIATALANSRPIPVTWGPVAVTAADPATIVRTRIDPFRWTPGQCQSISAVIDAAAASLYRDALKRRSKLAQSPGDLEAALGVLEAAGTDPRELVAIADSLASEAGGTSPQVITMGAAAPRRHVPWQAVLNIYVSVLQSSPSTDESGVVTRKALRACVALGKLDDQVAALEQHLRTGEPGLVGVLLYKVHGARRRDDAARRWMTTMLSKGERYFPKGAASTEVLRDGFGLLLAASELDAAGQALNMLDRREAPDMPQLLLSLAQAHRAARHPSQARKWLQEIVDKYPLTAPARRAVALLGTETGPTPRPTGRPMTEGQLTALAKEARLAPHRYLQLGDEYHLARRYADARKAYQIFAKRFDSNKARLAVIKTHFKEGNVSQGLKAVKGHVRRYPTAPGSSQLLERLRKAHLKEKDEAGWATFCLQVSIRRAAQPYLEDVADVLRKRALASGSATPAPTAGDSLMAALNKSPHKDSVLRLATEKVRSLRNSIGEGNVALETGMARQHIGLLGRDLDRARRRIMAALDRLPLIGERAGPVRFDVAVEPAPIQHACKAAEEALRARPRDAAERSQRAAEKSETSPTAPGLFRR